jgi:hypothetical protein
MDTFTKNSSSTRARCSSALDKLVCRPRRLSCVPAVAAPYTPRSSAHPASPWADPTASQPATRAPQGSRVASTRGQEAHDRSLYWCRLVANACSRGLTSPHFSADPSLEQPWQRGRLQRPAAVLRQPLLSCFSVVAHRAGARVREAARTHASLALAGILSLSQTRPLESYFRSRPILRSSAACHSASRRSRSSAALRCAPSTCRSHEWRRTPAGHMNGEGKARYLTALVRVCTRPVALARELCGILNRDHRVYSRSPPFCGCPPECGPAPPAAAAPATHIDGCQALRLCFATLCLLSRSQQLHQRLM